LDVYKKEIWRPSGGQIKEVTPNISLTT
jgi:hypothetical protein